MDKVDILCAQDSSLLREFSNRCIERLCRRSLLFLPLPFFHTYMDANVQKEVEKDRLIIRHAAAVFSADRYINGADVEEIFEKTKDVDRTFVRKVSIPSLSIKVRYEDIAEMRKERIRRLGQAVGDLLRAWGGESSFADAVKKAYPEMQFREFLLAILHLYNQETKMLSRSIRLFPPFTVAMDLFAKTLFDTMEKVSKGLSDACIKKTYGGAEHP